MAFLYRTLRVKIMDVGTCLTGRSPCAGSPFSRDICYRNSYGLFEKLLINIYDTYIQIISEFAEVLRGDFVQHSFAVDARQ